MFRNLHIENFKSIVNIDIPLGRVNVFIGANGSGKSNILEAVAMLSASKLNQLDPQTIFNKGVRVAKPNLTLNSFTGLAKKKAIKISLVDDENAIIEGELTCNEPDNIFAKWEDEVEKNNFNLLSNVFKNLKEDQIIRAGAHLVGHSISKADLVEAAPSIKNSFPAFANAILQSLFHQEALNLYKSITPFLIYNLQTNVLRGINSGESYTRPLGVNGEGLDLLLSTFDKREREAIKQVNFIDWLKDFVIDIDDKLKLEGHKLGRSKSRLYLQDKFMSRNNNLLSAENANEGALHAMFYIALVVSKLTPPFFAIDNIDNTLNPRLCENLIKSIAQLTKENNKQVLITTHNPSSLDGLNLNDDEQRLFVVKRNLKGHTIFERVKIKPKNDKKYKLSQLFIEDYVGGLNPLI